MNRIVRNLIVAAPLAAAALVMAPGTASAVEPGPVIVLPAGPGDPKPMDFAAPAVPTQPDGPDEFSNGAPEPTHPKPNTPQGPDDKAPAPKPQDPQGPDEFSNGEPEPTRPDGPDDLTAPEPCPTHGECTTGDEPADEPDQGCFEGCDLPEEPSDSTDTIARPTRIDAGTGATGEDSLELTWLLAGGALVTASGAAFAARARARSKA